MEGIEGLKMWLKIIEVWGEGGMLEDEFKEIN